MNSEYGIMAAQTTSPKSFPVKVVSQVTRNRRTKEKESIAFL